MSDIFISYRRGGASLAARQLYETISTQFRSHRVFFDEEEIREGEAFPDRIRDELTSSKITLVVVGPLWLEMLREREDQVDWVREELLIARNAGSAIVPVWVGGAEPFGPDDLTEATSWLYGLNGKPIRGGHTGDDVDALMRTIDSHLVSPMTERDASLTFSDVQWTSLLGRIREGTCVPIVGSMLGAIARDWIPDDLALRAGRRDRGVFTMLGPTDLPRVAQVMATERNEEYPKTQLRNWARERGTPERSAAHPYAVLADLQLPLYVTTNYDDDLQEYLREAGREPVTFAYSAETRTIEDAPTEPLTVERPGVLQLMGRYDSVAGRNASSSMVLTEDDFFQVLVQMVSTDQFFPFECLERLVSASLLFLGFDIADWRFRILLRGLAQAMRIEDETFAVLTVEESREAADVDHEVASEFAESYLTRGMPGAIPALDAHVHFGDAQSFTDELRSRLAGGVS